MFSTITHHREKKEKSPGCFQDWTGEVLPLFFLRLMHLYSNSFVMPGKQTSLCTPNHPAPNPGPRMISCTLWRTLPHFTALHLMENNVIVAFPHTLRRDLFYYILKAFKSVMHCSLRLLSEEKRWGEFMQLIKIFFPAAHAASCSCTSKWFSHKKLWEEASLYNTDSDTGKLHDLRKHSLVYQLKYAMTIALQIFQWPTANWNIHC